ncbi:protein serine/threonine phosphatase 2C [Schizophyllum commune H4-8]|uniref:protein serine/threonine phosphatase 2C n=1 Tax=Schizophyllum commune (strain H4-8 / FGSC 9210) TaxID=578458 RepID=UPI00215F62B2|nr:protein serine/threonine phosphatase 2C [Schizophyllum commune H4-8]KAI5888300.1 protein serine/threonine phosphatase 2C [Schizophyllum commune H4-8]
MTAAPESSVNVAEADLGAAYNALCTSGIDAIDEVGLEVHHSSLRGLKAVSEDRIAIHSCALGVLIAIFDGHYTDELSDYAAKVLPQQLCERISRNVSSTNAVDISAAVEEALIKGIEDFDASLLHDFLKHFPQGADTNWDDPLWDDSSEVFEIIGYTRDDPIFMAGRRTIVGSTALVCFVDKDKKNLWVASLGDSEAVIGRVVDGQVQCEILNDFHNCDNPAEVSRLQAEHPGEPSVVYNRRNLGYLAVTRALGDFPMKVGLRLTTKILTYAYPSYLGTNNIEDWQNRGHLHPPYISSTPTVVRRALAPGDVLIMSSDGLRLALEKLESEESKTRAMVALATDSGLDTASAKLLFDKLGHDMMAPAASDNVADRVIRNALFGMDREKMADALVTTHADPAYYRDDISVAVVRIT